MIEGAGKWLKDGLKQPAIVRDESLDSIESDDLFLEWKAEKCVDLKKSDGKTIDYATAGVDLVSLLNKSYNQWREARKEYPLSGNAFRDELNSHDIRVKKQPRFTYGFELTVAERKRLNPQPPCSKCGAPRERNEDECNQCEEPFVKDGRN
jgi:phage/plasmid-associated DNA primase